MASAPNEICFQKLPFLIFFDCRLFQSSLHFLSFRSLFLILPSHIFQMTTIELLVWAIHTLPLTARTCCAECDRKQEIQSTLFSPACTFTPPLSHSNKELYTEQRFHELIWREGKRFAKIKQQNLQVITMLLTCLCRSPFPSTS